MEIGIDILEIDRIMLEPEGIKRILSNVELKEFSNIKQNSSLHRQKEYLAGRGACKEAIIKAIDSTPPFNILTIEKHNNKLSCTHENGSIKISLTHNKNNVVAVALAILKGENN